MKKILEKLSESRKTPEVLPEDLDEARKDYLDKSPPPGLVQFAQRFVDASKKVLVKKTDPKFGPLMQAVKKAASELDKAIDQVL